jgi:hypothetical protein
MLDVKNVSHVEREVVFEKLKIGVVLMTIETMLS